MSSKSAIKLVVPEDAHGALYKWVTLLTGSKNAVKGLGFFVGTLLSGLAYPWGGLQGCLIVSAAFIAAAAVFTFLLRPADPAQAMPHTAG